MLEGVGMSKPAGKRLTRGQVLLIAKALRDRRRYEILMRLGECRDAIACGEVRDCTQIDAATLSHHMKELELAVSPYGAPDQRTSYARIWER
jgi:ArsR family transcriptional regulator, arsenate/arsenite/antimonite-responsive transcriptional repressor